MKGPVALIALWIVLFVPATPIQGMAGGKEQSCVPS